MSILLVLIGCFGPTEDTFLERYSKAVCRFHEECAKSAFLEEYRDIDDCIDESLDVYEDFDVSECSFDKDKAKSCIARINDATQDCDEDDLNEDDCAEVFDCSSGGFVGGPVTEENFAEQYLNAYCGAGCSADISAVCDSQRDFTGDTTGGNDCDFDAQAAAACVNPSEWSCDALIDGSDDTYPTAPAICARVCG